MPSIDLLWTYFAAGVLGVLALAVTAVVAVAVVLRVNSKRNQRPSDRDEQPSAATSAK